MIYYVLFFGTQLNIRLNNMQQELPLKFIRTNSQGENIEWIFSLIEQYEDPTKT